VKKHVPALVTQDKSQAQFVLVVLTSAVDSKEESALATVAAVIHGISTTQEQQDAHNESVARQGAQKPTATVATAQLVDPKTQVVPWAYSVRKASAGAYQSTAEAIAKNLKDFLEKHPYPIAP
jgi:flagellar motor protein MotB